MDEGCYRTCLGGSEYCSAERRMGYCLHVLQNARMPVSQAERARDEYVSFLESKAQKHIRRAARAVAVEVNKNGDSPSFSLYKNEILAIIEKQSVHPGVEIAEFVDEDFRHVARTLLEKIDLKGVYTAQFSRRMGPELLSEKLGS